MNFFRSSSIKHIIDLEQVHYYTSETHLFEWAVIYVFNFHISCDEIEFNTCTFEKAGGGIYIYLDTIIDSPIKLQHLYFNKCKAVCGGGIYVYPNKVENKISIIKSKFEANDVNTNPEKDGDFNFGGSAIYLAAINSTIIRAPWKFR